jgi:hypothetical protein
LFTRAAVLDRLRHLLHLSNLTWCSLALLTSECSAEDESPVPQYQTYWNKIAPSPSRTVRDASRMTFLGFSLHS